MERLTENYLGCNQIKDCGIKMCGETCKEVESCDVCPISKAIDKLAEYEQAEEQGLLKMLPCRVGDTVYSVVKDGLQIIELEFSLDFYVRREKDFGKTVFTSKAEAEQALAKMKGE